MADRTGPSASTPGKDARLSKAEAQQRLSTLKRGILMTTVAGFGVFSGLAAAHSIGAHAGTAAATAGSTQATAPRDGYSAQGQADSSGTSSQGGYFDQGQGGYGFGSGSTSQAPVAGSTSS